MSKEAEKYFGENVIWNGTVIMNPIDLMDGFHKSRAGNVSDDYLKEQSIIKENYHRAGLTNARKPLNVDFVAGCCGNSFYDGAICYRDKLLNK